MLEKQGKFLFSVFKKYIYLFIILFLITIFPLSNCLAISSTSYQIEPSGTDAIRHESTSTTYRLEGSLEPVVGETSSTSYKVVSGSGFAGYCGDGAIDPSEDCEGSNLNSKTCLTQGFATGTLACTSACVFDTSGCSQGGGGGGGGGGGNLVPPVPTIDSSLTGKTFTYLSSLLFFGTKAVIVDYIYVNGSLVGVTYPTSSRWQKTLSLTPGKNTVTVKGGSTYGYSEEISYSITRRAMGDVNLDTKVNDYDFSLLANNWNKNYPEADFNGNNIVDDYDLSLMVAYWTD